jgi:DNA polymerase-3 subunit alpha
MGINVLPPDINQSVLDFSVDGGNIRFGLAAVKNVGESAIESIIESRDNDGPFKAFLDFCSRVDLRKINKRVVESLIKCGAFDTLTYKRRQLMENFERIMEIGQKAQDQKLSDQTNLFDGPDSESSGNSYT